MKTGMHRFVVSSIDGEISNAANQHSSMYQTLPATAKGALTCVDWQKSKPHEMLGMSKNEYREARELNWTADDLSVWQNYSSFCETISPAQFWDAVEFFGGNNIYEIADNYICGEDTLLISDLYKYGAKQPERAPHYTVRLLIDYRKCCTISRGSSGPSHTRSCGRGIYLRRMTGWPHRYRTAKTRSWRQIFCGLNRNTRRLSGQTVSFA